MYKEVLELCLKQLIETEIYYKVPNLLIYRYHGAHKICHKCLSLEELSTDVYYIQYYHNNEYCEKCSMLGTNLFAKNNSELTKLLSFDDINDINILIYLTIFLYKMTDYYSDVSDKRAFGEGVRKIFNQIFPDFPVDLIL